MINKENILYQGFDFIQIDLPDYIVDEVFALPYRPAEVSAQENIKEEADIPDTSIIAMHIKNELMMQTDDPEILDIIMNLEFDISKYQEGDSLDYHFDIERSDRSYFHFNIWVVPDSSFKGRDFIYGTRDKLNRIKPYHGGVVLINSSAMGFIHAVDVHQGGADMFSIGGTYRISDEDRRTKQTVRYLTREEIGALPDATRHNI